MKAIISILLILTIIGIIEVDFSGGNLQRDLKYFRNFYQRVVKSLNSTSVTSNIIPENPPPNKIATNFSSLESSHDPSPFLGLSATLPSLPIAIETIIACANTLLELANSAMETTNLDFEEQSEIKELDSKFHEIAKLQNILPEIDEMKAKLVQLVNPTTQVFYTDLRRSLEEEENDEVIPLDDHDIEKLNEVQEKTNTLIELIKSYNSYNRMVRYLIISHNRGRNGTSRNVANRLGVGTKDDKDEISENVVTMWNDNTNWLRKTKQVISNLHWYIDFDGNIHSLFNDFCLEAGSIDPESPFKERRVWAKPCENDKLEQQWIYKPSTKEIVNAIDQNQCLEVYRFGTAVGSQLCSFRCSGGSNQKWTIQLDGYGRLYNPPF